MKLGKQKKKNHQETHDFVYTKIKHERFAMTSLVLWKRDIYSRYLFLQIKLIVGGEGIITELALFSNIISARVTDLNTSLYCLTVFKLV